MMHMVTLAGFCLIIVLQTACSKAFHTSTGPDGSKITLWATPGGGDSSLEIILSENGRTSKIYGDVSDRSVSPFHVTWTNDSKTVYVLVCNVYGPLTVIGYDRNLRKATTKAEAEAALDASIREKYPVPSKDSAGGPVESPISWLCSPAGSKSFEARRNRG